MLQSWRIVALAIACLPAAALLAASKDDVKHTGSRSEAKVRSDSATAALMSEQRTAKAGTKSRASHDGPDDASGAPSRPSSPQSLGAVRPSNLVLPQLAISSFSGGAEAGAIGQIIQSDLALADICTKPVNTSAAAAAQAQDNAAGAVNLDGWVTAGVHYVLRGSLNGGTAQAELFDVAGKQRLFGKSYSGFSDQDFRRLAHKVADDAITAFTNGGSGIFSSQICYLSDHGRNKEINVMDADGGSPRQVTSENSLVASPAWGKSGTEIYYTSYRDNNPDLYGITLNGRRFDISRRPGLNTSPSWSEALQRLAVSLSKDGNSELYTMTREGRDLARITNTPDADTAPCWSPDGNQIVFTSDRSGTPQIYIMSASGGGARRITGGNGYYDSPAWSPDGKKIAYVAREEGGFNIYVAQLDGGPAIQLTRSQRDNTDPAWGPDSKHLVFSSNRNGNKELYMLSLDTKLAHQLTHTGGATSPDWGPLAR
jgi:TolB protein